MNTHTHIYNTHRLEVGGATALMTGLHQQTGLNLLTSQSTSHHGRFVIMQPRVGPSQGLGVGETSGYVESVCATRVLAGSREWPQRQVVSNYTCRVWVCFFSEGKCTVSSGEQHRLCIFTRTSVTVKNAMIK